jgi:hypothetical protein
MRRYEIREEPDGFVFECIAIPHEPTAWGWVHAFRLSQLTEAQAHQVGVFTRMREDEPLEDMYEKCEAHIGRSSGSHGATY